MSKLVKVFAIAALIAGAFAMTPGPAAAQRHGGHGGGHFHGGGGHWGGGGGHWGGGGGHWGGGGWRSGGWGRGWGPGFVFGFGPGWGGYPYGYYDDYYAAPSCGWAPVRRWHNHHWVLRRAWRCW